MADSTKRQDREVTSTVKQDKKGFKVPRIPGDIMLYPLLVGLLLNSFCPQVLAVGSFTTAVVKGSSTIVGLLLIFMGASINLRAVPEALKTGVVVLVPKLALSIAFGLGVAAFCGNN
ncbi:MAG: 2-keto-3-deoxygluconate permease, partial [Lancefieldella rimae]